MYVDRYIGAVWLGSVAVLTEAGKWSHSLNWRCWMGSSSYNWLPISLLVHNFLNKEVSRRRLLHKFILIWNWARDCIKIQSFVIVGFVSPCIKFASNESLQFCQIQVGGIPNKSRRRSSTPDFPTRREDHKSWNAEFIESRNKFIPYSCFDYFDHQLDLKPGLRLVLVVHTTHIRGMMGNGKGRQPAS